MGIGRKHQPVSLFCVAQRMALDGVTLEKAEQRPGQEYESDDKEQRHPARPAHLHDAHPVTVPGVMQVSIQNVVPATISARGIRRRLSATSLNMVLERRPQPINKLARSNSMSIRISL